MLRTFLLVALFLASPALGAGKHPGGGAGGDPDACLSCHTKATPEVVRGWEGGPHGLVLVKCFVCHGSTGKDFVARPAAGQRCQGCHAAEVASVTPSKGKHGCFGCHAPHTLAVEQGKKNPHAAQR